MSDTGIKVENLSKSYIIGHQRQESYTSLRDVMADSAKSLARRLSHPFTRHPSRVTDSQEEFFALRDVSFEIKQGDRVGIIGRNGAGKSTLLKVLSRITEPTAGRVSIKGRVASLLEVGTGFHPELTGRENIYLNGAILGMSRVEIKSKFDAIVDFAEVERFLDTPVKRYSSGMYVRLAFAVAAHMEPEILIVDEVLAVGDAQFQKKCLGRMEAVGREGRTVLFVSHNMGVINQLCSSCILLDNGRVAMSGETAVVTKKYIEVGVESFGLGAERSFVADEKKDFQVLGVRLKNSAGEVSQQYSCDEDLFVEMDLCSRREIPGLRGYFGIFGKDGTQILENDSVDVLPNVLDNLTLGNYKSTVKLPNRLLAPGEYTVYLSFVSAQSAKAFNVDLPGEVCVFRLEDITSWRGNNRKGYFSTLLKWETTEMV